MKIIDFTFSKPSDRFYDGGTMYKKGIVYNDEFYMLKFQEKLESHYIDKYGKNIITYFNSIFSEYIASNIAESLDLEVHSTLLGIYKEKDEDEIKTYNVVACKDFLKENEVLFTIHDLFRKTNSFSYSEKKQMSLSSLEDVLKFINKQEFIYPQALKEFFWEMFVFDGYIGNFDRNPNNWGIIFNSKTGNKKIAPIFDNASCLHPKTPRNLIHEYNNNEKIIEEKTFFMPTMSFRDEKEGKRLLYNRFFEKSLNVDFLIAVKKIVPKILEKQQDNLKFIYSLDMIDLERRELLIKELMLRSEKVLKPCLKRAEETLKLLQEKGIEMKENSVTKLINKYKK